MLDFDSPRIRFSLGQAALHEPYPSWILDPYGFVRSANLMACWLWNKASNTGGCKPDMLVGRNIFDIFAANFERIPFLRNIEFYAKQSALIKRVAASGTASIYAPFIAKMKDDPNRASLYKSAISSSEHIWEYRLCITAPQSDELLEMNITNYSLEGEIGFLALSSPIHTTVPTLEKQHSELMTQYGEEAYILMEDQHEPSEGSSFFPSLPAYYRMYYPAMIQDPLWYIIEENKAQQMLFGASAVGMHFFELYFAPQLRPWLGPLQDTSAPRAMKYFETFTMPFQREEHELHVAYTQVLERLAQLPDYNRLRELSWKSNIHLNLPDNTDTPFYSCRVFLPWYLDPEVTLQFRSMVRYMHKGLLIGSDQQYYEEILIPENYETEVALILLYISPLLVENTSTASEELWQSLALLQTLTEGLANLERGDAQWDPEKDFQENMLHIKRLTDAEKAEQVIIVRLRQILAALYKKMEKETLLSLLKVLTTRKSFARFSAFLDTER